MAVTSINIHTSRPNKNVEAKTYIVVLLTLRFFTWNSVLFTPLITPEVQFGLASLQQIKESWLPLLQNKLFLYESKWVALRFVVYQVIEIMPIGNVAISKRYVKYHTNFISIDAFFLWQPDLRGMPQATCLYLPCVWSGTLILVLYSVFSAD